MMTTKTASVSRTDHSENSVRRLVSLMTWMAWVILGIGVLLCIMNLNQFNDRNPGLMIGIGFLVGSVHIYFIGTAMGLVHERRQSMQD
jgi:Na+/phosphate symporter